MAKFAPETPTTQDLNTLHPLAAEHRAAVRAGRRRVSEALRNPDSHLFAGVGACALTDNLTQLQREAESHKKLEGFVPGLVTGQRLNGWKPRSNPDAWHGMESTPHEVVRAHGIVTTQAARYGNAIMELGYPEHAKRYGEDERIILGWIGARADGSQGQKEAYELLEAVSAIHDLPVGIKNGLDGDITGALARAKRVEAMRGSEGAPAVVIYRGGANAVTPQQWEDNYKRLWDATGGAFVVDTAHDGSTAHDTYGKKSVTGQTAALDHVIELTYEGYAPGGVLIEASDTASVVDPNMPHDLALLGVVSLASIKMDLASVHI